MRQQARDKEGDRLRDHSLRVRAIDGRPVVAIELAEKWLTWAILIGSALIDGVLYLCVGDAIVCYRCGGHFRGFHANAEHKPFELTIAGPETVKLTDVLVGDVWICSGQSNMEMGIQQLSLIHI